MKITNVLGIVFITLLFASSTQAQAKFGVLGGVNLAKISFDPELEEADFGTLTAFGFGVVANFELGESLSLQLEPMYLQKGAKASIMGLSGDAKIKTNYLELPILFQYGFGTSETKPYITFGPTVSYLLSATQEVPGQSDVDIKEDVKKIDFGVSAGLGVMFPAGSNSVFVEGRYALGLTNVSDDSDDPDQEAKHKGIQFFLGIAFPIGSN